MKSSVLAVSMMMLAAPAILAQDIPTLPTNLPANLPTDLPNMQSVQASLSSFLANGGMTQLSSLAAQASSAINNLNPEQKATLSSALAAARTNVPTPAPGSGNPSANPAGSAANSIYKPIGAAALAISAIFVAGVLM